MGAFSLRQRVLDDYDAYVHSFLNILDERIGGFVHQRLAKGVLWAERLPQAHWRVRRIT